MMNDSAFLTTLFFEKKPKKSKKSRQAHKFFVKRLMQNHEKHGNTGHVVDPPRENLHIHYNKRDEYTQRAQRIFTQRRCRKKDGTYNAITVIGMIFTPPKEGLLNISPAFSISPKHSTF
jgi:hypothetical protein